MNTILIITVTVIIIILAITFYFITDSNRNINALPNLFDDLQKQINSLKTDMVSKSDFNTNVNTLTNNINNIINGKTSLQNTKITGRLTTDSLTILNTITPVSTTQAPTRPPSTTQAPPNPFNWWSPSL